MIGFISLKTCFRLSDHVTPLSPILNIFSALHKCKPQCTDIPVGCNCFLNALS